MIPKLDKYYNKEEHFRPVSLISRGDKHNSNSILVPYLKYHLPLPIGKHPTNKR
jgi:hypothetical protein